MGQNGGYGMDLVCEKYRETQREQGEEQARCLRPKEYCKFRAACIINLLGRDRDREAAFTNAPALAGEEGEKDA